MGHMLCLAMEHLVLIPPTGMNIPVCGGWILGTFFTLFPGFLDAAVYFLLCGRHHYRMPFEKPETKCNICLTEAGEYLDDGLQSK